MDAKITKERLSRMLSYDWLKIIGIAAAAIIVWVLVFTMTATRITAAQQFTAVNYFGNVAVTNTKLVDTMNDALKEGVFSYEVMEITNVDVPGSGDYGNTVLEARVSTYEGDVIFVPDIPNADASYEATVDGQTETRYDSYLQSLVSSYGYNLMNLDPEDENGYFKSMERFLNRYYGDGGYVNGTLDKATVETDFRARVERNKDKRFKKDEQIAKGIQDEIERIEKYRAALIEFYGYVDSGLISFTHTTAYDHSNEDKVIREGVYSINLCPNADTMGGLKDVVAYSKTYESTDGGESQTALVAENMNVAFFDFDEVEDSFEYENLLYINYLIRLVKTDA